MESTFADRRVLVIKKSVGLASLKRLYPALFTEEQVSSVFGVHYFNMHMFQKRCNLKNIVSNA